MANISKEEKDLECSSSPEIKINNNTSKNLLPSFLLDMEKYFKDQNSNNENYSEEEEKEINENSIDKKETKSEEEEEKNILSQNKKQEELNKYNLYNNKSLNNSNNNIQSNYFFPFPLKSDKNYFNNSISFNNHNSNYLYQNYFNISNNNSNNNSNILNNNNFINHNIQINPFSNSFGSGSVYQFNPMNYQPFFSGIKVHNNSTDNLNNNNLNYNFMNIKKCYSFNAPFSQAEYFNINSFSSEHKKHKKSKKEKKNEDNIILDSNIIMKKLLNMNDYSLYNYLITQKGSRDVQTALEKSKEEEIDLLINKLIKKISDITIDKYGNYFTQKLIQICNPPQRIKILESIKSRFVEIAKNLFGTHPLQNLMEIIKSPEEKKIVLSYILGNEIALSLDSKGTHVLQKFISNTVDAEREQLNENIINLKDKLITDPFGVCVLIKLVKHTKNKKIFEEIANYITDNDPLSFIQDPYANYAVQILINSTDLSYCEKIIETIVNNYLSLSMQKFSSNVVENCIKYGDEKTVKKIYKSIIEQEKLESLLNNNYGNYVLEKLISRLNKEEKTKMVKKIEKLGKTKSLSNTIKNLLYE